ncbi:MAG: LacI family transcriptional regulator [Lachnospiraceae bacterium]|jgi:LacI family transcriptional regulator|nr:LacI family transcriptional regulator [Lachnospiraceae bacterium]MCI1397823.1 LacI family transcriptional regulator [Lachnospiraceae bacterium]MCI1424707.1 LacI family transcriptional regulator [Lachnospiraceae bacterium]MCI1453168.1 LacI family transcriptional regulator [Lachnospiraceae bacterium]
MATLKDVAKLAHVDVSTVSRALNNSAYVHPDTKARIMKAVKELSYEPNILARGLRQGKRETLGVILPKLSYSIFAEVASGIESQARKHGYVTLVSNTGNDKDTEKLVLNRLRSGFIDALIIAGTGENTRLIRSISEEGMPVVQVIRDSDPLISSVVVDYDDVGYRSVQLLAKKGCRHIGLINGSMKIRPYAERYRGYRRGIREFGLPEITAERESLQRGIQYGYDCALQLIDENCELDGILAVTDTQAIGAMRALHDNDLSVPGQVRLLSMTGHQIGGMLTPSLTSMELPAFEIGERATDMALQMIEAGSDKKPAVQRLSFHAELVERESTQ